MSLYGVGVSAADVLTAQQNAGAAPKLIRASKTFTGAANLGATGVNELFTTTGAVHLEHFFARCTTDLEDTVDGAVFTIGVTGQADLFVDFTGGDLDLIDAGDGLGDATTVLDGSAFNLAQHGSGTNHGGRAIFDNIIMTISTQAITGGVLVFYVLYRPLSSDGALALGAGMVAV